MLGFVKGLKLHFETTSNSKCLNPLSNSQKKSSALIVFPIQIILRKHRGILRT